MTEIDEIRRRYEAGELDRIKEDLGRFIATHRAEICAYRAGQAGKGLELTEESAIKFFILRYRSINPKSDIQEQLEEIKRETWIRGIQRDTAPNPGEVALEWAREHSAAWRSHRVKTIVYVFEQDKQRYLSLLGG